MRIAQVRTHCLDYPLERAFESASGRFEHRRHCLVEIVCEDGTTGWGECLGPSGPNAAMVRAYARELVGRSALDTEVRWLELYHAFRDQGQRGLALTALSGLDIALWDIKGKHYQAPIYALLGGQFRDRVPAYATGGFRPVGEDRRAAIVRELAGYAAEGFGAVKIKIGFDPREDLAIIAAARETVGPDIGLMIDANHGYDAIDALAVGRAAARHAVGWFEEPVLPELLAAYRQVRAGQPLPVAAGETWHGRHGMQQALAAGAVDILQPDVCASGGFTEMRRIVDLAHLAGVRVIPHVWGSGVALAAALQVLASLPPDPPGAAGRAAMLEFDRTHNPCRQAVLSAPIEHRAGQVTVPDGPGLGITVDREALARFLPEEERS